MSRSILSAMVVLAVCAILSAPAGAWQVATIHEFAGGTDDGREPYGSLTLSGSTLYGMTYGGGDSGVGTVFSMGTNGSGFTLLHEFASGADDGQPPQLSRPEH